MSAKQKDLNIFEKYLTLWVLICIGIGVGLGKLAPQVATLLDSLSFYQVSIIIKIFSTRTEYFF